MATQTHTGSCHCGAVRFECDTDLASTTRCNCSFCHKARFWMTLVKVRDFRLLQGADALTDYQHTPPGRPEPFLHLTFCKRCGIRPFSRGGVLPQLGEAFYAVNIACFDDMTDAQLAAIPVSFVDGKHGHWDRTPAEYRHM
jgi:hypothetical protein